MRSDVDKSTTMRLILGLDRPTTGSVTVNGKRYADFPAPLHEVGAVLEARAFHTGRSARDHLLALAATHRIARSRVDELIGLVGLNGVAGRRAGGFTLSPWAGFALYCGYAAIILAAAALALRKRDA